MNIRSSRLKRILALSWLWVLSSSVHTPANISSDPSMINHFVLFWPFWQQRFRLLHVFCFCCDQTVKWEQLMIFLLLPLKSLADYLCQDDADGQTLRRITMETCSDEKLFLKIVSNIWHTWRALESNESDFLSKEIKLSGKWLSANVSAQVWLWHVFVTLWSRFSEWGCWEFKFFSWLRPCVCCREIEGLLTAQTFCLKSSFIISCVLVLVLFQIEYTLSPLTLLILFDLFCLVFRLYVDTPWLWP